MTDTSSALEEWNSERLAHWRPLVKPLNQQKVTRKGMIAVINLLSQERGKAYKYSGVIKALDGIVNSFSVERALSELTHIHGVCYKKSRGYWIPTLKEGEDVPYDELAFWEGCTTCDVSFEAFFSSDSEEDKE
jgi:hypothetical protein